VCNDIGRIGRKHFTKGNENIELTNFRSTTGQKTTEDFFVTDLWKTDPATEHYRQKVIEEDSSLLVSSCLWKAKSVGF
jgi:hypothetical protein